jgi:hypothetical protein
MFQGTLGEFKCIPSVAAHTAGSHVGQINGHSPGALGRPPAGFDAVSMLLMLAP